MRQSNNDVDGIWLFASAMMVGGCIIAASGLWGGVPLILLALFIGYVRI